MLKWRWIIAAVLLGGAGAIAHAGAPSLNEGRAAGQGDTRLILLGTGGGPVPRVKRSEPANLLIVDGEAYLVDCGPGTVERLREAGVLPTDVTRTFFTHLHFDHVAGFASLFGFNWASGSRRKVEVYGPPGTAKFVASTLNYLSIPEQLYAAVFPPNTPAMSEMVDPHEIDAADDQRLVYKDDRVRVFAVTNTHYVLLPEKLRETERLQSDALRFETADRTIVFTGDTGPSENVTKLAEGADILVAEVIDLKGTAAYLSSVFPISKEQMRPLLEHMAKEHLTPEEVGKMAAKAKVGMVVLSHLSPGLDSEVDVSGYVDGVRKYFHGPVIAGRDLDEF